MDKKKFTMPIAAATRYAAEPRYPCCSTGISTSDTR